MNRDLFRIVTTEREEKGKLVYDVEVQRAISSVRIASSVSERKMLTITYNLRRILESLIENDDNNETENNKQED